MIITVKAGYTLFSVSQRYGVPQEKIAVDNAVTDGVLVVGQSLVVDVPERYEVAEQSTTVSEISSDSGIPIKDIFRNNYFLGGRQNVPKNSFVVIEYQNQPVKEKIVGGYAYDFIGTKRLDEVINYMTYIMPFTYGFTAEGELIVPDVAYILEKAEEASVIPLLHLSTLTQEGVFDSNLPSMVFGNDETLENLLNNIMSEVMTKNYGGVDVDFEFLPQNERENYVDFLSRLSERLHYENKILVVALPPKTSDDQMGLLVEGIDYSGIGSVADYVLVMAYEYGYRFGPPLAIAPVNQVRKVLDYAVGRISNNKILLGISNYGYDWTLPFVRGESDAPSISTVEAIDLAKRYGAEIQFDENSQAPFFFYTDGEGREHQVWYEDARSFNAKFNLIDEYNLPGGFIWELMRENPQGYVTINSLVKIS